MDVTALRAPSMGQRAAGELVGKDEVGELMLQAWEEAGFYSNGKKK